MNRNQQQLQDAVRLFQEGRFIEAANIFEQLIRKNPNNYDALHFYGILKASSGQLKEAIPLIERSLATSAINLPYLENYVSILFQAGEYHKAAEICTKTIRGDKSTETLQYILAISRHKLGELEKSLDAFNSLLLSHPKHLAGTNEKASTLAELQRYEEAYSCVERALGIDPAYAEAWLNKGNILAKLKKHDESVAAYKKALSLKGNLSDAYLGIGNAFRELKRFDQAFDAYDRALALRPNFAEAWLGRGNAFTELRRFDEAFAAYERALAISPDLAEAWLGRGNAFTELLRFDEALAAYDKALVLKPNAAGPWLGRGNVFAGLRRFDEAFAALDKALTVNPDLAEAWVGRGNVFAGLRRFDEALAEYDKALALQPDLSGALLCRGSALTELKRLDEAFAACDRALALTPDLAEAWFGRGNVLAELKRFDEAFVAYDKALRLDPGLADAHYNKALAELCVGNFAEGWDLYEWRSLIKDNVVLNAHLKTLNASRRQDRSAFRGKKVAILSEQGVGDEIMFASILPDLISDAKEIHYEVDPRLTRLFEKAFPGIKIVPRGNRDFIKEQMFDVVVQAGSLGYAYRRDKKAFPRASYLGADPIRIEKWKAILASDAKSRKKIGLSWRGGTDRTRRDDRSIDLTQLHSLIKRDDCYFVSLQYGDVNDELERFNRAGTGTVHRILDNISDFDDFAALIMALDLVISVQNTTIHMCGALGKTCWGMIPWRPEWRYGNHDRSMIWYSNIELYRQEAPGKWDALIKLINANLTSADTDLANQQH